MACPRQAPWDREGSRLAEWSLGWCFKDGEEQSRWSSFRGLTLAFGLPDR